MTKFHANGHDHDILAAAQKLLNYLGLGDQHLMDLRTPEDSLHPEMGVHSLATFNLRYAGGVKLSGNVTLVCKDVDGKPVRSTLITEMVVDVLVDKAGVNGHSLVRKMRVHELGENPHCAQEGGRMHFVTRTCSESLERIPA